MHRFGGRDDHQSTKRRQLTTLLLAEPAPLEGAVRLRHGERQIYPLFPVHFGSFNTSDLSYHISASAGMRTS